MSSPTLASPIFYFHVNGTCTTDMAKLRHQCSLLVWHQVINYGYEEAVCVEITIL